ncbi:unnamed protein product [Kluyveromyces dobzhanskii CBS 2104]|uniref:WGS project CCBQ000000000 data, contig 00041 n=1 Tax=Kluyveromyces dobzhanskii CBS 2104 TaxID=1427455 RepID=A0A0A8L2F2_9SACH|nr:unnamed protein product [Kluyveromyces dobzhanskii CBS 2104]
MSPGLPSTVVIRRGLNICLGYVERVRKYSTTVREIEGNDGPSNNKELRNKEIAVWVQRSLFEPLPVQKAAFTMNSLPEKSVKITKTIDTADWERLWELRFRAGEFKCVNDVIKMRKEEFTLFTPSQLLVLLTSLRKLHRYYDIDRIYQVYRKDWSRVETLMADQHELLTFLKIMIEAESQVHNFEGAEFFFRKYIKQPILDPAYINMGLKALLENKDFITARQFFEYMLNNQEVFPVTHGTLKILLTYINHADDLLTLKTVFESWLKKGPTLPNKDNITLVHKQFLKFDEENSNKYWNLLLSHPRLQTTNYKNSDRYIVLEHISKLKNGEVSITDTEKLIPKLCRKERSYLYLQLLNQFVEQDDYALIQKTLTRIRDDPEVQLRQFHHSCLLKYYVKKGLLHEFVGHIKTVQESDANGLKLDPYLFFQIWECSFQAYPVLRSELEVEMKALFDRRWYKSAFPWLSRALELQSYEKTADTTGDTTFSRRNAQRIDTKLLKRIENILESGRYRRAKMILMDQARLGFRPSFQLFYTLKRFCVNNGHLPMSNILDTTLQSTYRSIPTKVKILNLRANLYKLAYQLRKAQQPNEVMRSASLKMIERFVKENQTQLNFQNYIQLATLASRYKGRYLCDKLFAKSIVTRNPTDGRSAYMIYRSLLAFFVRLNEPKKYLSTLKKLNNESEVFVTKYLLNTVKYNIVYFDKLSCEDTDAMIIEYEKLRKRYALIRLEGLDAIKELMAYLRKWLDHEAHKHQTSTYQKQLELKKQLKSELPQDSPKIL